MDLAFHLLPPDPGCGSLHHIVRLLTKAAAATPEEAEDDAREGCLDEEKAEDEADEDDEDEDSETGADEGAG